MEHHKGMCCNGETTGALNASRFRKPHCGFESHHAYHIYVKTDAAIFIINTGFVYLLSAVLYMLLYPNWQREPAKNRLSMGSNPIGSTT